MFGPSVSKGKRLSYVKDPEMSPWIIMWSMNKIEYTGKTNEKLDKRPTWFRLNEKRKKQHYGNDNVSMHTCKE